MGALTPLDTAPQKRSISPLWGLAQSPSCRHAPLGEEEFHVQLLLLLLLCLALLSPGRCEAELLKLWGLTVKSDGPERSGHPQHQASAEGGFAGS